MLRERRILLGRYLTSTIKKSSKKDSIIHDLKWGLKSNITPIIISILRMRGLSLPAKQFVLFDNSTAALTYFTNVLCRATDGSTSISYYDKLIRASAKLGIYHPAHEDIFRYIHYSSTNFKLLLHGSPGTGKTSLSNILEAVGEDVVFVKSVREDSMFQDANKVYVIDDVDLLVPNQREGEAREKDNLRKLLAILDKANKVILTTNNPQDLDPALTRAGRIDHTFEVNYLDKASIIKIINLRFMNICQRKRNEKGEFVYKEFVNEFSDWVFSKLEPENNGLYSPCKVAKPIRKCEEICRRAYVETVLGKEECDTDIIESVERDMNFKTSKFHDCVEKISGGFDTYLNYVRPWLYGLVDKEEEESDDDDDDDDDDGKIEF